MPKVRLEFRPADGLLNEGDDKSIFCVAVMENGEAYRLPTDREHSFHMQDLEARDDLISTGVDETTGFVKPPGDLSSYPKAGVTRVNCSYSEEDGHQVHAVLTLRILRKLDNITRLLFSGTRALLPDTTGDPYQL